MFGFSREEVKVVLVALSQYVERSEGDAADIASALAVEEQLERGLTVLAETGKAPPCGCGCGRGSTCDIAHDPATCPCRQCTSATRGASR
jgi:hypothetical protein